MKTVIFAGPSLGKDAIESVVPDALVLPPAEQGDIDFAARQLGADAVGLIDGVHSQRLPPWHKEILGVLKEGTRVLGAASMGALRAVECQDWGMEPVGEIAEWYASGQIEGDDEVCLAHGGEDTGYQQFSIPLVNVRATLAAIPSIMMSAARKSEVLEISKDIFYPERTWRRIQDACELRDFDLEEYEVDLKQADAMQLCYLLADLPPRKKPEREVRNASEGYAGVFRANDVKIFHHGKIHRLHEFPPDSAFTQRLALERKLALAFCAMAAITPREGFRADPEAPLLDLAPEEMEELIREEATLARAREWLASSKANFGLVSHTLDWLRVHGLYEQRKEAL
jgi:hypothetical protein